MGADDQEDQEGPLALFADESAQEVGSRELSILLVDDDPMAHAAMRLSLQGRLIAGRRAAIRSARSVEEARQALRDGPGVDLAILDLQMGAPLSGLELARWMRGEPRFKSIPIMIRSGHAGPSDELGQLGELGIEGWAPKADITLERFIAELERCCSGGGSHG